MASGNDKTSIGHRARVRTVLVRYKLVHIIPADLAIVGERASQKRHHVAHIGRRKDVTIEVGDLIDLMGFITVSSFHEEWSNVASLISKGGHILVVGVLGMQ